MSVTQDLISLSRLRPLRLLALTALVVGVGVKCLMDKLAVLDPDIWWHLCIGDWILQNRAFPHNGIFSHTATTRPWMAYSWGYEVLLARAYNWFSFIGVGVFGTLLTIAVALAIFLMLYRISRRFWAAWALSIVVYAAFLFNIAPRPVFLSVILFAIILTLLFDAQRTRQTQTLYWLPLLFLVWANIHIQFIYGLAVVGLFAGANLLQRFAMHWRIHPEFLESPGLPVLPPFLVLAACVAATCLGPYSYHLYHEAFVISQSKVMYKIIRELQALSFEYFNQYLELLLAVGAYFAMGWKKKNDPFKFALLLLATIFAFRTWRDAWFLCVVAAAIIADVGRPKQEMSTRPMRPAEWVAVAVASLVLLVAGAGSTDFTTRGLDRAITGEYPVDAVNFLRRNPVGGPLYNSFDWGGFLIFYMPQYPVSIDGRTDLYGDAMDEQYYSTQEADPSYMNDPALNEAGVVLLKKKFPIATQLQLDRRFRVIYRDDLAVVFARNW
ncbi:MAG TPA: hypothetical protein VMG82_18760 [Candidatus Sulfotelmatobacter sp.]|nr:hypothetical protein [Candidatus Sulfotelmatobacter sp.]